MNVCYGCVDLQVIAMNTESPMQRPSASLGPSSVRQKKSSYFELHTIWLLITESKQKIRGYSADAGIDAQMQLWKIAKASYYPPLFCP